MAEPGATLLARLATTVGAANVLTAREDIEPYVVDWRGRFRGAALAVVRPHSTEEVSTVVRACVEQRVAIVPQGGNTSMCGAATPDVAGNAVVLSTSRLNRVRGVDIGNATMTLEAGVTLSQAQAAASDARMLFPLSLASEGSCTIGGNLSTNAGGTAVLRFGNARDLALGLEVVLPDGRVWDGLRGLRKDNTGYDLKHLFIGGEGTLGVITAAVLKLFPAPRARATALVAVADAQRAVRLLTLLKQALADRLVGFEIMNSLSLELSRKHHAGSPDPLPGHPWYVLVQADDPAENRELSEMLERTLAQGVDEGIIDDATLATSDAQRRQLWSLRENISEAQRREGPNIKHDISVPVSAIPQFLHDSEAALSSAFPGVRFVTFGHLGDGNLHYNLSAPPDEPSARFMERSAAANRIVHDLVAAAGGSISAEHGIGQLKRDELKRYTPDVELDLMRRIKAALDPEGLMNPGKIL
jgi:FAD/FMN-containing dehydrogenase